MRVGEGVIGTPAYGSFIDLKNIEVVAVLGSSASVLSWNWDGRYFIQGEKGETLRRGYSPPGLPTPVRAL
jgi:hypothetical protein